MYIHIFLIIAFYIALSLIFYSLILTGTERAIKDEPSKRFSSGLLEDVAVGCSVATAVIIFVGLYVFRRLNPNKIGECMLLLILLSKKAIHFKLNVVQSCFTQFYQKSSFPCRNIRRFLWTSSKIFCLPFVD